MTLTHILARARGRTCSSPHRASLSDVHWQVSKSNNRGGLSWGSTSACLRINAFDQEENWGGGGGLTGGKKTRPSALQETKAPMQNRCHQRGAHIPLRPHIQQPTHHTHAHTHPPTHTHTHLLLGCRQMWNTRMSRSNATISLPLCTSHR